MLGDRRSRGLFVVALMAVLIGAGAIGHAVRAAQSDADEAGSKVDDLQQKVEQLTNRVDDLEAKLQARD